MFDAGREVRAGLCRWKAPSGYPRWRSFKELAGVGGGGWGGCPAAASAPGARPSPPLLPRNPGERSAHVASPRRAWPRSWACSVGSTVRAASKEALALLRSARPVQARPGLCVRGAAASAASSRGRLTPDAVWPGRFPPLTSPRGRRRGGAGPAAGGAGGPGPGGGGGGCWESRGGGGWGRCGVTGVGSPRWLREANREVRGPRGRRGEDQPRPGSSGDSGAGPGLSGRR